MPTTLSLKQSLATLDRGRKGKLWTKTEKYPTQNANPQTLAITGVPAD
ncbi:MAG: hypothetical protein U0L52_05905 [Bacteroidaceae bacterium]|nr:hypothetical protein [Bacteroidaceae bacterium]